MKRESINKECVHIRGFTGAKKVGVACLKFQKKDTATRFLINRTEDLRIESRKIKFQQKSGLCTLFSSTPEPPEPLEN